MASLTRKLKASDSKQQLASGSRRIGLYIRVSTEEQAENPEGSIRNQEMRLRETVKLRNLEARFGEVVEVFIDRARSGKDMDRPELQRLLSKIRSREIDLVMVSELSRLSRSIKDFAGIWEMMRGHGCGFQSLRENFDTTTAAGEMVLYTVANIAQFERRQVSERVSANFESRASRGLYNGGTVPLGYKLMPNKPGHLDVDDEAAQTVREVFSTFLQTGGLSLAAKRLNTQGYRAKRETQGGNHAGRSGFFSVDNVEGILRNKAYIGVRRYKGLNGSAKEVAACWPAIVDVETFDRVQKELDAREICKRKPESEKRYPFLLTGLVRCASCGAHMVGKSAHGNSGKVPYYEHGWAARQESVGIKKVCNCRPFRLQAKKLEPAVWSEIERVLMKPEFAGQLIRSVQALHATKTQGSEIKKRVEKLRSLGMQMEVLAERLAELPKSVSPLAIFKQMERLEGLKKTEEDRLAALKARELRSDPPAELASYEELLRDLRHINDDPQNGITRDRIVRSLVAKVEVTPEGFRMHFHLGKEYIEGELARWGRSPMWGGPRSHFSLVASSNTLTSGAPGRARTCDLMIRNHVLYPVELRVPCLICSMS